MSFSTVIVTGRYESADGPARGTVTFTRSALLRDSATGEWWLPTPLVAHLDSEGVLRVPLIANNDPTTVPTGSTYTVQEAAGDCTRTYSITVPYNQPNGILDLIDVATGSIPGAVSLAAVTGGTGGGGGGGGAGSLTPPVTIGPTPALLDGDTSTYPLVVSAAVDATNDQATTMIVGNADPAYGLDGLDAYSGSSYALYGRSTSGAGVRAISTSGAGLSASSESGVGITAAAASGAGVTGISTSNTGVRGNSATQDGIQGAGGRYGGYFTGAVAALCAGGAIEVRPATEPDTTPGSGIGYLYLDSADNTAKVKTDDGVVHPLW